MIRNTSLLICALGCTMGLLSPAARPDSVGLTLTLSNPNLSGLPGSVIDVSGTLTNNSLDSVIVFGDAFTLSSALLQADDTAFQNFLFSSGFTLNPGSQTIALFAITIDPLASPGSSFPSNSFVVSGLDLLGNTLSSAQDFTVTTVTASDVPEPSSIVMLLPGVLALASIKRRKITFWKNSSPRERDT